MPAWFHGLGDASDLWSPFAASGSDVNDLQARGSRGFTALAKIKSGTSIKSAQAEMDGISKRLEQAYRTRMKSAASRSRR